MSKRLPSITSDIPRDLRNFIDRLREIVSGGGAGRLVTAQDLSDAGVINVDLSGAITPATTATTGLVATPPAPTGVTATGAINNIIVDWDEPNYKGHAYAEIWRSDTNNIGLAVQVGMTPGSIFTDPVGPGVTKYYWVRYVNINDETGPYNAVSGTAGTTGPAIAYIIGLLTGQITATQLDTTLTSRINLVDAADTVAGSVNARVKAVGTRIDTLQGQVSDLAGTAAYSDTTAYVTSNLVTYNGGLYRALQNTTGNLPTNTTYWDKIGDYTSLGQAVAANANNIETVVTDLTAEISARTSLAAQVNNATTGLAATRATLANDYYTKASTNDAISTAITNLSSSINIGNYATIATLTNSYYTGATVDSAITSAKNTLTTNFNNALSGYTNTSTLNTNYYTKTDANTAISNATTTLSAQLGKGGNMVDNSDFAIDLSGWTCTRYDFGRNLDASWTLSGAGTAYIHQPNQTDGNYGEASTAAIPVIGGKTYEWSVYTGAHRCQVEAFIYWFNSGGVVGYSPLAGNYAEQSGGPTLAGYKRLYSIGVAPSGATYGRGMVRKNPTFSGQGDSWAFFTYAYFGEAGSQQTTPSAYSPGSSNAQTSAVQTSATATANTVTGLSAQYTVKVDTNGYVSGFGLASTANNAAATSTFGVRADTFYIANPSGPGIAPAMPFIVRTTGANAGVYLTTAFIEDGTITNAKIGSAAIDNAKIANLDAAKITSGFISADRISAGSFDAKIANIDGARITSGTIGSAYIGNLDASKITTGALSADRIDSRNLTIKDSSNNVIFGAGTKLNTPYIEVGAASAAAAIGMVETFVYATPSSPDGITLSTGTLVTLTTTGAPVTVWVSGYGIHANYGSSYATGFAGSIALLVDNDNVYWPNGYYAQSSYQHVANSGIGDYNVSLVWRGTLSAGTHTFKIASGMAPAGPGGAAGSWGYFGYGTLNVAMVVMENKL